MRNTALRLVLFASATVALLQSCKKDDLQSDFTPPSPSVSEADKLKDSTLAYARDIYLWYDKIPATFNARNYDDPNKIMTALRQYSSEPGFAQAVDRWSFAVNQDDWDDVSSGVSGDFGISVFFRAEGDLRVKMVEENSPAGRAGVQRGWRITKINGSTNMTTSNANAIVNGVYYSSASSFTFQKPDNSTLDMNLTAAVYQEQPVHLDTLYTINGARIGYMVFNSFMGDTTRIYNEFSRVFNRFAQANVSDVVIDLRYNGGGYVTVANKLANYLAPSSANGGIMMKQQYNNKYTQYNSTTLFNKLGSVNLSRMFFIVSNSSASASELLINNLKPYIDVNLVGPSSTYGKPVGYFPIPVGSWYIFPVSFKSVNKNGEGNYYNGLAMNNQVADGLDKNWGDITESSLQSVVNYITTGQYRSSAAGSRSTVFTEQPEVKSGNTVLDKHEFKGAVSTSRF